LHRCPSSTGCDHRRKRGTGQDFHRLPRGLPDQVESALIVRPFPADMRVGLGRSLGQDARRLGSGLLTPARQACVWRSPCPVRRCASSPVGESSAQRPLPQSLERQSPPARRQILPRRRHRQEQLRAGQTGQTDQNRTSAPCAALYWIPKGTALRNPSPRRSSAGLYLAAVQLAF
jgi:hypothetical protein